MKTEDCNVVTHSFSLVTACLSVEKSGLWRGSVSQHLQHNSLTAVLHLLNTDFFTTESSSDWLMLVLSASRVSGWTLLFLRDIGADLRGSFIVTKGWGGTS